MALGFLGILVIFMVVLALLAPRIGSRLRESRRARIAVLVILVVLTALVGTVVFNPSFGGASTSANSMVGGLVGGSQVDVKLRSSAHVTWHLPVGVLAIWVAFWVLAMAIALRRLRLAIVLGVIALVGFGTWGVLRPRLQQTTLEWGLRPGKNLPPPVLVMPADIGWARVWTALEHPPWIQTALLAAHPTIGADTTHVETTWVDPDELTEAMQDQLFTDLANYSRGVDVMAALAADHGDEGTAWRTRLLRDWLDYLSDLSKDPRYGPLREIMLELGKDIADEARAAGGR